MKTEKQSEKLRKELALFVEKMQLEGVDIMAIKKTTSASNTNRQTQIYVSSL
ncbi:hypothetical protein [Sporosarcina sp. FSL K6-3508]|uniref:hypothetical protein n=1 Tax=Sporosarcina sp. FSL K6-3508 TaxID=2921557 RepID=UPI00315A6589